jgi:sugar phosphate isomerase/epimerase
MEIGIVDYLLRVREEACFYMVQELGFDCLELSVDHVGDPARLLFSPDHARDLQALSRATDIPVRSVYATHFIRENLVHPDEHARKPAVLALQSLAEQVGKHGIRTIVLPLYGASDLNGDAEAIALQQVLDLASTWGALNEVRFALKTSLEPRRLLGIIDRYDAQWIGVCYDPANGTPLGQNPPDDIRLLRERILHIHLKDRQQSGNCAALGQGNCDLKGFVRALKDIDYAGPIILETPSGRSAIESAKSNLSYCRRTLAA